MAAVAAPTTLVVSSGALRCRHPIASSAIAAMILRFVATLMIVTRRSCERGVVWPFRLAVTAR